MKELNTQKKLVIGGKQGRGEVLLLAGQGKKVHFLSEMEDFSLTLIKGTNTTSIQSKPDLNVKKKYCLLLRRGI